MNTVYGITSRQEDNNDIIMCTNIIYETANKQSIAADREYETLDYEEIPVKSPAIITTKFTGQDSSKYENVCL
jgi:electron transfer flavoprotein alpha/beta subunit